MFAQNRLIHKMPTKTEVLSGLGTKLPSPSEVSFQQLGTPEGMEHINGPKEMVVFAPETNPQAILDHPVLGKILAPYATTLFAERRSPVDRDWKPSLKNPVTTIPVKLGSVEKIHIILGSSPEGDPEGDEFHIPRKVRTSISALKDVVGDINREGQDSIGIFLDGEYVNHQNLEHVMRAMGIGLGNITYETDLYRTEPGEKSIDGQLSEIEGKELELAKSQGWAPSNEELSPEGQYAELQRQIEDGSFTLNSPEAVTRQTRNAVKHVYLMSDTPVLDETVDKTISSFRRGDMISRVQSMCKFLAEAPHRLLNCELFVRILDELNRTVKAMGTNTEIEIYGPTIEGITITGSLNTSGRNLEVMRAVHEGSGKELGPFMVRMKYRHPEAADKSVYVVAGKSLMFDNGGNIDKGLLGEGMQGDMMAGAGLAATFARFGEEKPKVNVDFVWGIASNKADGDARNLGDIYRHGSGVITEEAHPDAEGRQVLTDALWAAIRRLREEGEEIAGVITAATLTGAAMLAGGYRTLAISTDKQVRRLVEDLGIRNGERLQPEGLVIEDTKATSHGSTHKADAKNVDLSRLRGAQNAAAYIKDNAGIRQLDHLHLDIAPAMTPHRHGTPKDVQGEFAAEGFLDTLYTLLAEQPQRKAA